jgi:hypothetical protein
MIGYGIPINEFSFGNTLIIAGVTALVGGLIVIAIGIAVGHLQRIAEVLGTRVPARSSRPLETFEPRTDSRATPAPGRFPFPARSRSETTIREPLPPVEAPAPAETVVEDRAAAHAAPMLRNPELTAVEEYEFKEYEEASLSPQQSLPTPSHGDLSEPAVGTNTFPASEPPSSPAFDAAWRAATPSSPRPPQASYFDAMWPAEARPVRRPAGVEAKPEPALPPAPAPEPQNTEPPVAILKSGIVDGMGYTLYVDGSIEAELPQGTLRFASIHELRGHLAKNS